MNPLDPDALQCALGPKSGQYTFLSDMLAQPTRTLTCCIKTLYLLTAKLVVEPFFCTCLFVIFLLYAMLHLNNNRLYRLSRSNIILPARSGIVLFVLFFNFTLFSLP